jgi:hypothetical protein
MCISGESRVKRKLGMEAENQHPNNARRRHAIAKGRGVATSTVKGVFTSRKVGEKLL